MAKPNNVTVPGDNFQRHHRQRFWFDQVLVLTLVLLALIAIKPASAALEESRTVQLAQAVELRGRVVCLAEEMHKLHQTELSTDHAHLYGFKTNDGKSYTLLRTKMSETLFVEQSLRDSELIIKGRVFPGTQILEVVKLFSVHNGEIFDVYYYCVVCAIQSVTPGICVCCQDPVELVEKPLKTTPPHK
jgi:hypothetical protein